LLRYESRVVELEAAVSTLRQASEAAASEAADRERALTDKLSLVESREQEVVIHRDQLEGDNEKLRSTVASLQNDIVALQQLAEAATVSIENLSEKLSLAEIREQETKTQKEQAEKESDELRGSLAELHATVATMQLSADAAAGEAVERERILSETIAMLESHEQQLTLERDQLEKENSDKQNAVDELQSTVEALKAAAEAASVRVCRMQADFVGGKLRSWKKPTRR
jgi:chromosome segregation ATPase